MKSEIKELPVEPAYPCLKIYVPQDDEEESVIVLFAGKNRGMVVGNPGPGMDLGTINTEWTEANFKLFTGEVTLSN